MTNVVDESHCKVLELVDEAERQGHVALTRFVLVRHPASGAWRPAFGRIDLAQPDDPPSVAAEELGEMRILADRAGIDEFRSRLLHAMEGKPFQCMGESIEDHGLQEAWSIGDLERDRSAYHARWPVRLATSSAFSQHGPELTGLVAGTDGVAAYDGFDGVVQHVCGFSPYHGHRDARRSRLSLVLWDARGRIDSPEVVGTTLKAEVVPKGDQKLVLLCAVTGVSGRRRSNVWWKPESVTWELGEPPRHVKLELKQGDVRLELWERWFDPADTAIEMSVDELTSLVGGPPARNDAPIKVDDLLGRLAFMKDDGLRRIVTRDIAELQGALDGKLAKSSLILCGSILEAVLLDVLDRKSSVASSFLTKPEKWPREASLPKLIEIAALVEVPLPGGASGHLLGSTTAELSRCLMDHRDLVHPHAELRGEAKVTGDVLPAVAGVLRLILCELAEAHTNGVLSAYESI